MTLLFCMLCGTFSILFVLSSTPLMMTFIILCQATLISLMTLMMLNTSWFSFVLFLIFVSAMMIIYAYVASLASNDFFTVSSPQLWIMIWLIMLLFMINLIPITHGAPPLSQLEAGDLDLGPVATYKIYTPYTLTLTSFMIIYLLLALIVVAKTSSYHGGALRSLTL